MILETVKERYKNWTRGSKFKHFHWWEVVRNQLKWRAKSVSSSTTDPWVSSSDHMDEEDVTHPIGWDRAKVATRKGKVREGSST
jgi:hypothetical protein